MPSGWVAITRPTIPQKIAMLASCRRKIVLFVSMPLVAALKSVNSQSQYRNY